MQITVETRLAPTSSADVAVYDTILQAPAGSRTLESPKRGCAELQSQVALVVGILVEAGRGAPEQGLDTPEPPPPTPPPEPPAKQGFERRRPRKTLSFGPKRSHRLGLVATGGWGLLPGAYPGAELRWSVSTRKGLPIRVTGAFEGPGTKALEPGQATLYTGRMTLGVCPEWPWRAVKVGFCGLAGLGATRLRSRGLRKNEAQREPSVVVGAEGFVVVPLAGPAAVVLGMQALAVPYRPRFAYEDYDREAVVVFHVAPLTFRGHGGLQLRFR